MTSRKINSSRKLSFQQLEARQLMAYNVTAVLSNHSLTLTGDNYDDQVLITQVANQTNQFTVAGFYSTTINGKHSQTFSVTGNISVNFKGANDFLQIGDTTGNTYTTLPGSLNTVMGNGNNIFELENTSLGGNLTLTGGSGNDSVWLDTSNVGRGGNHDCSINLGGGANQLYMNYTTVERDLLVHDTSTSSNDNIQMFGGRVGRNATIQTGNNNDSVQIDEYYFAKALNIQTGAGADFVSLGESFDSDASGSIPTSRVGIHADSVFADLGAGDDTLRVSNVSGQIGYDGNTGTDYLFHDDGSNHGSDLHASGFEYMDGVKLTVSPVHQHISLKAKR